MELSGIKFIVKSGAYSSNFADNSMFPCIGISTITIASDNARVFYVYAPDKSTKLLTGNSNGTASTLDVSNYDYIYITGQSDNARVAISIID